MTEYIDFTEILGFRNRAVVSVPAYELVAESNSDDGRKLVRVKGLFAQAQQRLAPGGGLKLTVENLGLFVLERTLNDELSVRLESDDPLRATAKA